MPIRGRKRGSDPTRPAPARLGVGTERGHAWRCQQHHGALRTTASPRPLPEGRERGHAEPGAVKLCRSGTPLPRPNSRRTAPRNESGSAATWVCRQPSLPPPPAGTRRRDARCDPASSASCPWCTAARSVRSCRATSPRPPRVGGAAAAGSEDHRSSRSGRRRASRSGSCEGRMAWGGVSRSGATTDLRTGYARGMRRIRRRSNQATTACTTATLTAAVGDVGGTSSGSVGTSGSRTGRRRS